MKMKIKVTSKVLNYGKKKYKKGDVLTIPDNHARVFIFTKKADPYIPGVNAPLPEVEPEAEKMNDSAEKPDEPEKEDETEKTEGDATQEPTTRRRGRPRSPRNTGTLENRQIKTDSD